MGEEATNAKSLRQEPFREAQSDRRVEVFQEKWEELEGQRHDEIRLKF